MRIGIDFDGTYAADSATFQLVADLFRRAGHECVIVTNRPPADEFTVQQVVRRALPVVYCNGEPKRRVMEARGTPVDVWIDDNPVLVDFGLDGLVQLLGSRAASGPEHLKGGA
jgi:hypothetical protein